MVTTTSPTPASVAAASRAHAPERMSGAHAIVRTLEDLGTDLVFGIPGGAVLPLYDALHASTKLRHVLTRHEQGAGHAAEGYAQASGKVGVCIATSGPGATNLVTALADANLDSVPIVAITGQVGSNLLGTDAFQEADIRGVTMPITKHNYIVTEPRQIPAAIAAAFHLASTGRPGPVLVDIPKDVQNGHLDYSFPTEFDLPGYKPTTKPHHRQIAQAVELIAQAEKPVIYAGGGVIKAEAARELRAFAEFTGIPVVTTLTALGSFPESHPLHMGMPGMHGTVPAVAAMQRADLLIAIGARFDDRVTGDTSTFAPEAQVIHADIDPAEIGKIREVDVPIVGDAQKVLAGLLKEYRKNSSLDLPQTGPWRDYLDGLKERFPRGYDPTPDGQLNPQFVLEKLSETVGPEAIYCAGVGQHQMWAAQYLRFEGPNRWMTSGGLGTMGYGLPASIGVQVAHPEALVINVAGDASWLMNMQEMGTAVQFRAPVKQFILNNERLGMVRQWQQLLHGERYSQSWSESLPDFVKLAEAFGCKGRQVSDPAELDDAIREMIAYDGPFILDVLVEKHENCFPMIPSGKPHNEMLLGDMEAAEDIGTAIQSDGAVLV